MEINVYKLNYFNLKRKE